MAKTERKIDFSPKYIPLRFAGAKIEGVHTLYGDLNFCHIDTDRGLLTISWQAERGDPDYCDPHG